MFNVLIADDDFEDRELLRLEIERAVGPRAPRGLSFSEAKSVKEAKELLRQRPFDLLTLDIQFDKLNEGLDALPEIFEEHPTLNIIVISGKINKAEVLGELFKFTKDNILKGKRWARHFDILDKKDDKTEALRRAHEFVLSKKDAADQIKGLFALAEEFMDKGEMDKCIEVYEKIQRLAPGEAESGENIALLKGSSAEQALEFLRKGENLIAALLIGHHIEVRLKAFTRKAIGRFSQGLFDCLRDLDKAKRISPYKKQLFQQLLKLRNRSIHKPQSITEADFEEAFKSLKILESDF